ncbi:MAG: hypothetical protein H6700_09925, partial [Myxococcales bacterium]|nr:hypothetical protein [Myxococcales bacterium]
DLSLDDYYGQPRDLSQYDDVRSIEASVFSRPLREAEIAERNRTLKELRRPAFDYGAYFVARRQRISPEAYNTSQEGDSASDITWVNRDAKAYIPDLWFRLVSEPRFRTRLRLEGEVAMILGSIGSADPQSSNDDKQRDIRQLGAAIELDYTRNALAVGLNAGAATGRTFEDPDSTAPGGFGVNDSWTVRDDEPTITNFKFDRNYFVDAIMFREVIGTITNAAYFNPFFSYDLFSKQDDNLGLRLDLISALALQPDATPSGESFYGVETDVTVYYREPQYGADIMAGMYIPGAAFNGVEGRPRITNVARLLQEPGAYERDYDATTAWTLQGHFYWAF